MLHFDSIGVRAMLTAMYLNGLDLYPDEFARLIHASAPTKAQVAAALGGASGSLADHEARLTNELRDINGWWDDKARMAHGREIDQFRARAQQAAALLVTDTLAALRQNRAILVGQYQADYEGRHPEYQVNWPGTEGGVPQLGERDDEPDPFFSQ